MTNPITGLAAFSLAGQHVLVTGAGRGLGQGMALAIARAGAHVTLAARSKQQLAQTAEQLAELDIEVNIAPVDLANYQDLDAYIDQVWNWRPIDGVVNAAGLQIRKPAIEFSVEEWDRVQAVQLAAPYFLTKATAARQLQAGRSGSHVLIGSLTSTIGLPNTSAYGAAKSGIVGLTHNLSTEWSGSGIRVNAIGPGYFHTALTDDLFQDQAAAARVMSRIPMGRLGTAADLGGPVVFLLSAASGYITGQLLNVDGGWLAA